MRTAASRTQEGPGRQARAVEAGAAPLHGRRGSTTWRGVCYPSCGSTWAACKPACLLRSAGEDERDWGGADTIIVPLLRHLAGTTLLGLRDYVFGPSGNALVCTAGCGSRTVSGSVRLWVVRSLGGTVGAGVSFGAIHAWVR